MPQTPAIPPDDFVQSFLKAAQAENIAAIVLYGAVAAGRPTMRMASNRDKESTAKVMNWVQSADQRAILSAAQHIHSREGGCFICTAFETIIGNRTTWVTAKQRSWNELGTYDQEQHIRHVVEIMEVLKSMTGNFVSV